MPKLDDKQSYRTSLEHHTLSDSNTTNTMPIRALLTFAAMLGGIVIVANYTVQFRIGDTPLTFGALTYPFSFLLLDILSEKYPKKETIKVVGLGIMIAFLPSYFAATPQIACASILAFCISQPLDVVLFYTFKRFFPKLWWLRNGCSTIIAQFFDTMVFFNLAFFGTQALATSMNMALADYSLKALVGIANTPIFYLFAIRIKNVWKNIT